MANRMTTKALRFRNLRLIWIVLWGVILANGQQQKKPNILVIFGDDVGYWNVSAYNRGMMGYRTPNIDRLAKEGALFTDYYGQQSCTAGRAAFISGQSPIRTGLTRVGLPRSSLGLQKQAKARRKRIVDAYDTARDSRHGANNAAATRPRSSCYEPPNPMSFAISQCPTLVA